MCETRFCIFSFLFVPLCQFAMNHPPATPTASSTRSQGPSPLFSSADSSSSAESKSHLVEAKGGYSLEDKCAAQARERRSLGGELKRCGMSKAGKLQKDAPSDEQRE